MKKELSRTRRTKADSTDSPTAGKAGESRERSPWRNVRDVYLERGRCQWHDTELLEMVPELRGRFYCVLCANEYRITKNIRPA
jgi:hypothetical protein